jgi:uncharacterized protein (DUF885 family)
MRCSLACPAIVLACCTLACGGPSRSASAPPAAAQPPAAPDASAALDALFADRGPDSTLLADFKTKVGALELSPDDTHRLTAAATAALVESVEPAYEAIIAAMTEQAGRASTDDGVWRFPDGADYYATLLRNYTTTELSADQIHELGLQQVTRIHQEMAALMQPLHIRGTLPQLLATMRDRKDLYYPGGPSGRAMYLAETQKALDAVTAKLPRWFGTLPRAPLVAKPVEPFREKSAGKAFYQRPAPDGSRPGTYYVNLYDMAAMPTTEVEALVYHEGIPGHHLQLAAALGDRFDIRAFHDVVLRNGPVPLDLLDQEVTHWIERRAGEK